jgi:CMP-N,N'-diacetyllegionaminic acid synthase
MALKIKYNSTVLALIPARSGSKSITDKNVRNFAGKPLFAHSIQQAIRCQSISRVILSTDSKKYAKIAKQYGAEVPFLRPGSISLDHSTDFEVFNHALKWLAKNEGSVPSLCVHLRPTHPIRLVTQISEAIILLQKNPGWDSVRSVIPAPDSPYKMWFLSHQKRLLPVIKTKSREAHSQPRQSLRQAYLQNASIDVIRSKTILEQKSIAGKRIGAFLMNRCYDIDEKADFSRAQNAFSGIEEVPRGKTFVVDIDGIIAKVVPANDYSKTQPIRKNIALINSIYKNGNQIILFTARGSATGKNWQSLTKNQLSNWGVCYHKLLFGKPAADYYIDDRMMSLSDVAAMNRSL